MTDVLLECVSMWSGVACRMLYGFSRDRAVPYWWLWTKVDEQGVPINAGSVLYTLHCCYCCLCYDHLLVSIVAAIATTTALAIAAAVAIAVAMADAITDVLLIVLDALLYTKPEQHLCV